MTMTAERRKRPTLKSTTEFDLALLRKWNDWCESHGVRKRSSTQAALLMFMAAVSTQRAFFLKEASQVDRGVSTHKDTTEFDIAILNAWNTWCGDNGMKKRRSVQAALLMFMDAQLEVRDSFFRRLSRIEHGREVV